MWMKFWISRPRCWPMEWKGRIRTYTHYASWESRGAKSPRYVCRINFNSYSREPKHPHNSEVLKLLREQEAELSRYSQENRNYNYNSNEWFWFWRSFAYCFYFPWHEIQGTGHMYHFTSSFDIVTDNQVAVAGNLNISSPNFLPLSNWSESKHELLKPIFVPQIKADTRWFANVSFYTQNQFRWGQQVGSV